MFFAPPPKSEESHWNRGLLTELLPKGHSGYSVDLPYFANFHLLIWEEDEQKLGKEDSPSKSCFRYTW